MIRLKKIAMSAAMAVLGASAMAAAPTLPENSVAPDTIAVIHLDGTHFTPDAFKASVKTVLGQAASRADEVVGKFQEKYDKAIAAGIEDVTVVMTPAAAAKPEEAKDSAAPAPKPAGEPNAVVYIHTKAGSDPKAIEALVTEEMKPVDKANAVFEEIDGNYLVMHEKDKPLPATHDADRAKTFSDALGTISEAAVQVAVIPDGQIKEGLSNPEKLASLPKGLKDAAPAIAASKWLTLAINFGETPAITLSANTADADSAKKVSDGINDSLDDLKKQAANPDPNGGPIAMFAPLLGQLVDGLRPTTTGTQVSVALKGPTLTTIANLVLQFTGGAAPRPPQQ